MDTSSIKIDYVFHLSAGGFLQLVTVCLHRQRMHFVRLKHQLLKTHKGESMRLKLRRFAIELHDPDQSQVWNRRQCLLDNYELRLLCHEVPGFYLSGVFYSVSILRMQNPLPQHPSATASAAFRASKRWHVSESLHVVPSADRFASEPFRKSINPTSRITLTPFSECGHHNLSCNNMHWY